MATPSSSCDITKLGVGRTRTRKGFMNMETKPNELELDHKMAVTLAIGGAVILLALVALFF